jgi:hypothetical protein
MRAARCSFRKLGEGGAREAMTRRYTPSNPHKYIGKYPITYRNSWQLAVMKRLDEHPQIICWAWQPFRIPYRHPSSGKRAGYSPNFWIVGKDESGKQFVDVVEVAFPSKAKALKHPNNVAKWTAAHAMCAQSGMGFRIADRDLLFASSTRKK